MGVQINKCLLRKKYHFNQWKKLRITEAYNKECCEQNKNHNF